jgi:uncharacterized damage-inducible protein DinB
MTQGEIIRGRLKTARWWLDSVLTRLTPEMLGWAPKEGMRTISGQLVEIIEVEAQLVPVMVYGKTLSDEELAAIVGDPTSLEGLKNVLTEVRGRTLAHLDSLSEADLAEEVSLPQWYGAYWPKPGPLGEHFRNTAEHEFYHAGQLMSYLWAAGDNPFDW